jgi:MazG family protein
MNRHEIAAKAIQHLLETMHTLRAPGGCPWDAEQTITSLRQYLIEEMYEVLDALDEAPGSDAHREELGDLLLQIVFQAEILQETQPDFDFASIAHVITHKLIRRHPHVFGDTKASNASEALKNWEQIKSEERGVQKSRLHGVPKALPALLAAQRTGEKAAVTGFDWPDVNGALLKAEEEWDEFTSALAAGESPERIAEELGDHLFAISSVARHLNIDIESCLRRAVGKFTERFKHMEATAHAQGQSISDLDLNAQEVLWQHAKRQS